MGGSGLWLLLDAFEENVVFYLTPTKLLETNPHRAVRLGGDFWCKIASNREHKTKVAVFLWTATGHLRIRGLHQWVVEYILNVGGCPAPWEVVSPTTLQSYGAYPLGRRTFDGFGGTVAVFHPL